MPAIRGMGSDNNGIWIEPNWLDQGTRVYVTQAKLDSIDAKGGTTKEIADAKTLEITTTINDSAQRAGSKKVITVDSIRGAFTVMDAN